MKIVCANNDFRLVLRHPFYLITPLPDGFDHRFHSLGPAVHREHFVRVGQLAKLAVKRPQLIISKGSRGQRQPFGLIYHGLHDFGVAVSLTD
ncbi:MAG: hypothetical protein DDT27_01483 [Dehalococcoidia bacterium]|nr:hypothetical protein [Chloroflexota bacterium]